MKFSLNEEVAVTGNIAKGIIDVNDYAVRCEINNLIAGATSRGAITPYVALQRVRKILATFHIHLPAIMFLDGDHGVETVEVNQFGEMSGMRDNGEIVTKTESPYHLYFEYQANINGMYDVFCEIVDEDELEQLLDDVEDEYEDEDED